MGGLWSEYHPVDTTVGGPCGLVLHKNLLIPQKDTPMGQLWLRAIVIAIDSTLIAGSVFLLSTSVLGQDKRKPCRAVPCRAVHGTLVRAPPPVGV